MRSARHISVRRLPLVLLALTAIAAAAAACGGDATVDDLLPGRDPTPTATPAAGMHHPAGWAAADAHGHAAKFVTEDCRGCHGATLTGGSAVGCDGCHMSGWRTSCTFCHGGTDNQTGAPPLDITGAAAQDELIFKSHTKHVQTTAVTNPFECVSCHAASPVTDALDPEHWFDDTHGRAEVSFVNGLSATGVYDYDNGRCSQLWCHGNGRASNGVANYSDGPKTCDSCHRYSSQFGGMSGEHAKHMGGDVDATCNDCHGATVSAAGAITGLAMHVNGAKELLFPTSNVTWNAGTGRCTGICHGDNHQAESW